MTKKQQTQWLKVERKILRLVEEKHEPVSHLLNKLKRIADLYTDSM